MTEEQYLQRMKEACAVARDKGARFNELILRKVLESACARWYN